MRRSTRWTNLKNPELGFKLLQSAAKAKDGERANFYLGKCYEQGAGAERNLRQASRYYGRAARGDVYGADEALEHVRALVREERESVPP